MSQNQVSDMSEKNGNTANGQKQNEGRDNGGRFAKGNKGGPGNPFARQTAALRKAGAESGTPEKTAALLEVMYQKGMGGDVAAAKLWLAYTQGRPGTAADPDTIDAHDLEVRRKNVAECEDITVATERVPAALMARLASLAGPALHAKAAAMICGVMAEHGGLGPHPQTALLDAMGLEAEGPGRGQAMPMKAKAPSTNGHDGKGAGHAGRDKPGGRVHAGR